LKYTLCLFISLFFLSSVGFAAIDFDAVTEDQIDTQGLKITKAEFLAFASAQVSEKKPGLGTYGIVDFDVCAYPVQGKPLNRLKDLLGMPIRLASTPSCKEMVINKVLVQNYGFDRDEPNAYKARRCVYTLIKAFRPMMEYYSMKYEKQRAGECTYCERQQRRRLSDITKIEGKTTQFCGSNQPKVKLFLNDLSQQLDLSYKEKTQPEAP